MLERIRDEAEKQTGLLKEILQELKRGQRMADLRTYSVEDLAGR